METAKMRILHTNFLRGWGGQSNRVLNECEGLVKRGHEVLLSVPSGSELAKRARAAGVQVTEAVRYCGGVRLGNAADIRALRSIMRSFRPDVLHLHGGRDSWVAAAALLFWPQELRPKVIRTKHNMFPIAGHLLNRWMYGRFFDYLISISTGVTSQCAEKPWLRGKKIFLIPSACDASRFKVPPATRDSRRREFGFSEPHVVIAMTGRLRPEKGHDVLLDAASQIVSHNRNVRFLLLGSGSLQGELAARVQKRGLQAHIVLAGFRDDVPECLSAADLYVQPSLAEGLGTSVLEAGAAGLAIAASDTGGIPDIVIHEKTGLLVTPGSPQSLAQAVIRMLDDAALRTALGDAARQHVRDNFSLQALIDRTEQAMLEICPETKEKR